MLLVVVLRDILISGIRMVAANKNFVIPADIFGKVKSFFLDIANMVLILYIGLRVCNDTKFVEIVRVLGLAIMIVGVVLSIVSCVNYTVKAVKVLSAKPEAAETEEVEETETKEEKPAKAAAKKTNKTAKKKD